ncbi:MAG: hypothetical protein CVU11_12410 [Bacteroidetes bacterium HGW-Bacteroidetes-6]|nr:MAG: hypothetical protein CVU11_12410 [Bacteroidetes bacterium HGW-Bacteroidetes-6]
MRDKNKQIFLFSFQMQKSSVPVFNIKSCYASFFVMLRQAQHDYNIENKTKISHTELRRCVIYRKNYFIGDTSFFVMLRQALDDYILE